MGCRVAAFITLLVIIGLDLLTNIAAVPASQHVAKAREEARASRGNRYRRSTKEQDDVVPIHRREFKAAGESFSLIEGQYSGNGLQAYEFRAPKDTRLSIEFQDIEFNSYSEDTLTAYSGPIPTTEWPKTKTTDFKGELQRKQFKEQMGKLPFLFSTRNPGDTLQEHAVVQLDTPYYADNNELVIAFEHATHGRGFTALIQVHKVAEPTAQHRRRDGGMEAHQAASFPLCSRDPLSEDDTEITQSALTGGVSTGTIISHREYENNSEESRMTKFLDKTCSRQIKLDDATSIELDIQTMRLTTSSDDCELAFLKVIDHGKGGRTEKFCNDLHENKKYEFSNNIELILATGSWDMDLHGFQIMYTALKSDKDEEQPEIDQSPGQVDHDSQKEEPESTTPQLNRAGMFAEKMARVDSTRSTTQEAKPLPAIFIVSVIVVAILLIIILAAAGAIACYRTHQQDEIINSLTEKIIQSNTPSADGSMASLCHQCHASVHLTPGTLVDSSHGSIVSPLAMGVAAKAGKGVKKYYACDEQTKLLSSSPSGSEESKPTGRNDRVAASPSISPSTSPEPSQPNTRANSCVPATQEMDTIEPVSRRKSSAAHIAEAVSNTNGDYVITIERASM